jgi:transposase
MAQRQARQRIPVELSEAQFNEFVLPHLPRGRRGPLPRLPLYRIFNYILKALYLGCQWHMLPIDRNQQDRREIHPTSIYRIFRRWQASGCFDAIFLASVRRLQQDQLLDLSIIHGDGTTTAAKKGGDNLGFSGHKKLKGCKVHAGSPLPSSARPGRFLRSGFVALNAPQTLLDKGRTAGRGIEILSNGVNRSFPIPLQDLSDVGPSRLRHASKFRRLAGQE